MKHFLTILFFGLSFPILSGQIYTTKLQAPDSGTVAVDDVSFGPQGQIHVAYMEYVTINPNGPIIIEIPWLARLDSRLSLDTSLHPLDSIPLTSQHLTPLKDGELLLGFGGRGLSEYNTHGYSYAILDKQYLSLQNSSDTGYVTRLIRHSKAIDDSNVLGVVYKYPQSDSLKLFNAYTGKKHWSIPRISGLPFAMTHIQGVNPFSDSLRVFLYVLGSGLPCPRWNELLQMATLHRATGALGTSQRMSDTLISVSQQKFSQDYGLLYLDKARENLTYERRDSNWQILSTSRVNLNTLLSQYQLSGFSLFTEPQVLKNDQGVGFLVSSGGVTDADTVYYLRLGANGQLLQKERVDSLPSGIRECRSLSGPQGSYFAIIQGPNVSPFILKAQPRNRIGLPAREALSQNLQVSPIPATDQLQLSLKTAPSQVSYDYRLHGLTGQMYQHGTLAFSGGEATLDLNELAPGTYFLILEAGEKRYRARVLVE